MTAAEVAVAGLDARLDGDLHRRSSFEDGWGLVAAAEIAAVAGLDARLDGDLHGR